MTNTITFEMKHHTVLLTLYMTALSSILLLFPCRSRTFESSAFLALDFTFPDNFGTVHLTVKQSYDIKRKLFSF